MAIIQGAGKQRRLLRLVLVAVLASMLVGGVASVSIELPLTRGASPITSWPGQESSDPLVAAPRGVELPLGDGPMEPHPLVAALRQVGAVAAGTRVIGWRKVEGPLAADQLRTLLLSTGAVLGAQPGWRITETGISDIDAHKFAGISIEGLLNKETYLQVSIQEGRRGNQSVLPGQEGEWPVLLVNLDRRGSWRYLDRDREQVSQAIGTGGTPWMQVQASGVLRGRLSTITSRRVLEAAFLVLDARTENTISSGNTFSATGFSPLLASAVWGGNRMVNVQGAVRYHSVEDATYIELGSPLLDGDF